MTCSPLVSEPLETSTRHRIRPKRIPHTQNVGRVIARSWVKVYSTHGMSGTVTLVNSELPTPQTITPYLMTNEQRPLFFSRCILSLLMASFHYVREWCRFSRPLLKHMMTPAEALNATSTRSNLPSRIRAIPWLMAAGWPKSPPSKDHPLTPPGKIVANALYNTVRDFFISNMGVT